MRTAIIAICSIILLLNYTYAQTAPNKFPATGNVGIGTSNPINNLQIGTQSATSTATPNTLSLGATYSPSAGSNPKLKLYDDGTTFYGFGISTYQMDAIVGANTNFAWWVNGSQKMILNSTGNLGIGTTTPSAKLQLITTSDANPTSISSFDARHFAIGSNASAITFSKNTATGGSAYISSLTANTSWDPMGFQAKNFNWYLAGTATPSVVLNAAGYLGIGTGTASPTNNLQIGNQTATSTATPNTLSLGATYSPTAGSNPKLKLYDDGTTFYGFGISAKQMDAIVGPSTNFAWWVNGTQKMILNSTGNLGVGTMNPGAVLDVGTLLNPGALGTVLARLAEGNGSGAGTYLGVKGYYTQPDPKAPLVNVVSFAIEHSFYGITNSSINFWRGGGSSGGSISFNTNNNTEVMRLLYNGNVLIGKTIPSASNYMLDVNGSVRSNSLVINTTGADFVFDPTYALPNLTDVKAYIEKYHHLPEIPSAKEMQTNGLNVGENQTKLLQKVEELTLYMIEKDKKLKNQDSQLKEQYNKLMVQDGQLKDQDNKLKEQELRLKKLEEMVEKLSKEK